MGCCGSVKEIGDLTALDTPINVFGEKWIVPKGKDAMIYIRSKFWSLSDGSFTIRDVSETKTKEGTPLFACKGQAFSLSSKRTIFDASDGETPVFGLKEKLMQIDDKQSVCKCTGKGKDTVIGDEMFKVGSDFGNTNQYTVGLKNLGVPEEISMQADFVGMKGGIWLGSVDTGVPIAKFVSPLQLKNVIPEMGGMQFGGDDYFINVAAGVDMALVVALVLAYEEMNQSYD